MVNHYYIKPELRWSEVQYSNTPQHLDWNRMWQSLPRLSLLRCVYHPSALPSPLRGGGRCGTGSCGGCMKCRGGLHVRHCIGSQSLLFLLFAGHGKVSRTLPSLFCKVQHQLQTVSISKANQWFKGKGWVVDRITTSKNCPMWFCQIKNVTFWVFSCLSYGLSTNIPYNSS